MITYVKLQNYKSFGDTIFDFWKNRKICKKFVAIYGENGSGKSNFVDSLCFLRLSLESFHLNDSYNNFLKLINQPTVPKDVLNAAKYVRPNSFTELLSSQRMVECPEPTTIECGFIHDGHKGVYSITFDDKIIRESLYYFTGKQSGALFEITDVEGSIKSGFSGNFFGRKEAQSELLTLIDQYWGIHSLLSILNHERETKNQEYIKSNYLKYTYDVIDMFMHLTAKHSLGSFQKQESNVTYPGVVSNPMEGLISPASERYLDQTELILNSFFTQAYADIKKIIYVKDQQQEMIHYKLVAKKMINGKIRDVDFNNESAGTKRILLMINDLIGSFLGGTIVYDEIDNGIHDLLLKAIISSMDEWIDGQLIITTHNTYLLESLNKSDIYVITVDYQGNKEVRCLDEYDIHGTNNVRNMYIKGVFGGVPFVDTIEYGEIVQDLKRTDSKKENN